MQSPPRAAAPLHAGSFRAFRRQMRPPGRRAHTICWCPLRRRILRHARPGRPPCARFARRFMQSPGALRDWRQMPALKHLATPPSGSALALAMSTGVVNPKPSPAGGGGAPAALVPASAGSQADAVDGALPAADAETDPDHPPVTQRELRGWCVLTTEGDEGSRVCRAGAPDGPPQVSPMLAVVSLPALAAPPARAQVRLRRGVECRQHSGHQWLLAPFGPGHCHRGVW